MHPAIHHLMQARTADLHHQARRAALARTARRARLRQSGHPAPGRAAVAACRVLTMLGARRLRAVS